jgi:hypothetical protein
MTRLEQIYSHYRNFCLSAGIEKPMAAQLWLAITDYVLKPPPTPKPPASTAPEYCPPRNPEKDLRIARAKADGLTVRQFPAIGKQGFLHFKTCRVCGGLLPIERFSKQGKSKRSNCKTCDNHRRRPPSASGGLAAAAD